jgi:dihydroorotase
MGTTGLETAFAALYTELVLTRELELAVVIERMTAGAALYALGTPTIAPDAPADITVVDLHDSWEVGAHGYASRSANCCFHGRSLHGRVLLTIAAGQVAFRAPMLVAAGNTVSRTAPAASVSASPDGERTPSGRA